MEIGLVFSRDVTAPVRVDEDDLGDPVGGLVLLNDVSARDVQLPETQFYKGKSYRTFGPAGPYLTLVSAAELRRFRELHLRLSVNGEVRQDALASDMVHEPPATLSELSGVQDSEAGDLLATRDGASRWIGVQIPGTVAPIPARGIRVSFDFRTSLLLAPLAYAIHHAEEHLLFDFRVWRLAYFADNNPLSTEVVFLVLTAITLVYILLHCMFQIRATAWSAILFLMATQVANAVFHLGGTLVFRDFSPGLITGLLLYAPVNFLIGYQALREGWVTGRALLVLFLAGSLVFALFEMVGPLPMLAVLLATYAWIGFEAFGSGRARAQAPERPRAQSASSSG